MAHTEFYSFAFSLLVLAHIPSTLDLKASSLFPEQSSSFYPPYPLLHIFISFLTERGDKEKPNTDLSFPLLTHSLLKKDGRPFNLSATAQMQMDTGAYTPLQFHSRECIPPSDVQGFASVILLSSEAPRFNTLESSPSPSSALSPCSSPKPCEFFLPNILYWYILNNDTGLFFPRLHNDPVIPVHPFSDSNVSSLEEKPAHEA